MSVEERVEFFDKEPTIVTGLADAWPAMEKWKDPKYFADRFGNHTILARHSIYGNSLVRDLVGKGEIPRYEMETAAISVSDWVTHAAGEFSIIMDVPAMSKQENEFLIDLSHDYGWPAVL